MDRGGVWGDVGELSEMSRRCLGGGWRCPGVAGRCREMLGDVGRCWEMLGDAGRCLEMFGDVGDVSEMSRRWLELLRRCSEMSVVAVDGSKMGRLSAIGSKFWENVLGDRQQKILVDRITAEEEGGVTLLSVSISGHPKGWISAPWGNVGCSLTMCNVGEDEESRFFFGVVELFGRGASTTRRTDYGG